MKDIEMPADEKFGICSDCGKSIPQRFLSPSPETEKFCRDVFYNINHGIKSDTTNVDIDIWVCPNCRAIREQEINRKKETI